MLPENHSLILGFVWRSQAVLPLNGSLLANGTKVADITSSIRFPESYEMAFAYWPLRNASHTFPRLNAPIIEN